MTFPFPTFCPASKLTAAFVASSTSTTHTVPLPTGVQSGDVVVLFAFVMSAVSNSTIPTDGLPTGFTEVANVTGVMNGQGARLKVSAKVLAAADVTAGSVDAAISAADVNSYGMLAFRPSGAVSVLSPSTWSGQLTSGDPTAQTVPASAAAAPVIVFGWVYMGNNAPAFSTETPAFDETIAISSSRIFAYKIYNTSPADHTVDCIDSSNYNGLASGYLELA